MFEKTINMCTEALKKTSNISRNIYNGIRNLKNLNWEDIIVLGGGLGGSAGGILCGGAGALIGAISIPAICTWSGAELTSALFSQTGLQTAEFLGTSAISWLGGTLGFVGGTALSFMPLTKQKPVKKTEYHIDKNKIEIPNEENKKTVSLDLENVPRLKISEESTKKSPIRVGMVTTSLSGLAGVLTGAFTGATAAVTTVSAAKGLGYLFDRADHLKNKIVSKFKSDEPNIS